MAMTYIQPKGDPDRRVEIPYSHFPSQTWQMDAAYTFFEGRRLPVGARGEHVTNEWTLTTVWPPADRPQAEAFLALLRDVLFEADARLDLHLDAPPGGTELDLVVEAHDIPQALPAGVTNITVIFREVDG